MKTPLAGFRVLSLAEQYPGPFATMILADLGADVILVERPNGGDPTRRFSGHFEALSRNKRSVAVNLKSERGRDVFLRLAETADVVVEGFRPGVVDRLGIGAQTLRRLVPSIVYASISSFGQTGPLSPRGGHDLTMQAAAALVATRPGGGRPAPAPLPLADIASAMYAALGIVTALLARQRSSEGSHVDISMLDALVSWRSTMLVSTLNELDPAPYPPDDPGYGVFVTEDGRLLTLSIAGEDHQWRALCEELGLDDLADLREADREKSAESIDERLACAIRGRTAAWLEERCAARGIGAGIVKELAAVAEDPQVVARGLLVRAGDDGPLVVRQPLLFDGEASTVRHAAPLLGEHTRELLKEVGYADGDIDELLSERAVAQTDRTTIKTGGAPWT